MELVAYEGGARGRLVLELLGADGVGDPLARLLALQGMQHRLGDLLLDLLGPHRAPALPAAVVAVARAVAPRAGSAVVREELAAVLVVQLAREGVTLVPLVALRLQRRVVQVPLEHRLLLLAPKRGHAALYDVAGVHVGAGVLRAPQHVGQALLPEPAAPLRPVAVEGPHGVGHRAAPHDGEAREVQHVALPLVDHVVAALNVPAVHEVAVGLALRGVLLYAVAHPLGQDRALPLRKHLKEAELQDARGALPDLLAGVENVDPVLLERDARQRHLVAVAHYARNLVDHHVVELPLAGIREHALEARAVGVAPRLRVVAILLHDLEAVLLAVRAAVLHLDLDGLVALVVA